MNNSAHAASPVSQHLRVSGLHGRAYLVDTGTKVTKRLFFAVGRRAF
jgi:hypothetical protein